MWVRMNRRDIDTVKLQGLKRRTIRRKIGSKPPVYIRPRKKSKGSAYTQSIDYEYFYGHLLPDIAKQLPPEPSVICWHNDHMLSLPVCAIKKFWKETVYCKRCPLFQRDEYAQELRSLIKQWETDDLMEE